MGEPGATAPRVLILGGSRSGKSEVAERLVADLAGAEPVTYVATARSVDGEAADDPASMARRVQVHRARRPSHWVTVESGADLAAVIASLAGPILVDSLGPWVAASHPHVPDVGAVVDAIRRRTDPTVLVSDEVGLAVHPLTEAGRWFVDALGTVNQAVASACPDLWLVVAGRVLPLPSTLPALLSSSPATTSLATPGAGPGERP